MTEPFIKYLRIENYKSIDKLELRDIPPFAVFAGANGSGKSNFFDALEFVKIFTRFGIDAALEQHRGFDDIHCVRRYGAKARKFEYAFIFQEYVREFNERIVGTAGTTEYNLEISHLDKTPHITESLSFSSEAYPYTRDGDKMFWFMLDVQYHLLQQDAPKPPHTPHQLPISSNLSMMQHFQAAWKELHTNLSIFRIDPLGGKYPSAANVDKSQLDKHGHNVAAVLERLEKDDDIRTTIMEYIGLCVPNLEELAIRRHLDGSKMLMIKESGVKKKFPAHLISDGTIYLLSLLVAILDKNKKRRWVCIEEPERGLHPKAIAEMIDLMRRTATPDNPIWLTTHSETVVRCLRDNELWFVEKENGVTQIKPARQFTPNGLTRNQAWLANGLGGGLPW